ncbi:Gfo/Idh/MocA family protein [Nisaea denitrificans]|uniref:Gfo/Idh/MocA family protein n=1 Tax=Nisaea denitrificans TaxID=390877 RepID=UPI0004185291|nr:Gfo/Idh/MocA family oxidoreductase [Nisaea denitrificans]
MVGGGYFGRFHINAWRRIEDVDLVGVADLSETCRSELATLYPELVLQPDIGSLLTAGSPDILDVAVPPAHQADLIRPLLGKIPTIICQKPFCRTLAEAEDLVNAADQAGTTLIVHENFRFMPWYRAIRDEIDNGRSGAVRQACFRLRPGDGRGVEAYLLRQPYFHKMERFLVHETGIHWIDVFRYLFGEPQTIYADLWRANPTIKGEDAGLLILTWPNGLRATLDANRTLDHAAENHRLTMGEFILEGDDATITLDGYGNLAYRLPGTTNSVKIPYHLEDRDFGGDCVFGFQQHVISHLLNGTPLETHAKDYLQNIRIEEAAYRSAEERHKIDL